MGRNADIVRSGYEHFAATGDMHPEIVATDSVWDMSPYSGWPEDQTYEGVDGARAFLRRWGGTWDDWELEVQSLHEAGDQVLAMMHQSGRSKEAGLLLEMTFAMLWTLRDGMEIRMEMYSDPRTRCAPSGSRTTFGERPVGAHFLAFAAAGLIEWEKPPGLRFDLGDTHPDPRIFFAIRAGPRPGWLA